MREKHKLYRPIITVMIIVLLLQCAIASYYDHVCFYISGAVALIGIIISLIIMKLADRNIDKFVSCVGDMIASVQADTLINMPIPVMVASDSGEILWYNTSCRDRLLPEGEWRGRKMSEIIGRDKVSESRYLLEYRGRRYTVFCTHNTAGREDEFTQNDVRSLSVYYFSDETEIREEADLYWESRPSIFAIMIDSLEEVLQNSRENERSQMLSQIEYIIEQFVSDYNGFVIKHERDRFFAIIEERHMQAIVDKRFDLLDKVRALATGDMLPITLSIGVARNIDTFPEGEAAARQALDMAQGRGGDQVAVKTPNGYDFYGGVSKGVEKRTKVKTRIVATALLELIQSSSNVIIMGHKFADLDSLGAAVGLLKAVRKTGKHAVIAINRNKNLVKNSIENLEKNGYENSFYNPSEVIDSIDSNTLLIIVDTHLEHVLESSEIYRACKNVAIIDHHRRMVGYIDNSVIFYHEPYASSASEMVTELLQYFGDKYRITRIEAEALLAGIMLDTRNFVIRTGVRTFEAAAYLRRQGADTVEVRKMFSSTMESYQHRARVVSSAEIYRRCALSAVNFTGEDIKLVAPQAADELLSISDVDSSFVMYEYDDGVSISARSMGKINVQVIMEALGGGGHQTMAATQIAGASIESARQKLFEAIDEYAVNNNME